MKVRFYLSQYPEENGVISALHAGCSEPDKTLTTLDDYKPSDVAVVMGYKKKIPAAALRTKVISEQEKRGLDSLILETGYINRGSGMENHYSLGWNGLNGRADFKNNEVPPDRGNKWRKLLKPWRTGDGHVLLTGQVPWDASVEFTDHIEWLKKAIRYIVENTHRRLIFRPHPKGIVKPLAGAHYHHPSDWPLWQDLRCAHCLVTFNSNTGVDAILNGVPVFSHDEGSMVYSVSRHDWKIESPVYPDREKWLDRLAYCQWTPEEMRSGEAWSWISRT